MNEKIAGHNVIHRNRLIILGMILDARRHGHQPSFLDLCFATGTSFNAIASQLAILERDGLPFSRRISPRAISPTCRFISPEALDRESPTSVDSAS